MSSHRIDIDRNGLRVSLNEHTASVDIHTPRGFAAADFTRDEQRTHSGRPFTVLQIISGFDQDDPIETSLYLDRDQFLALQQAVLELAGHWNGHVARQQAPDVTTPQEHENIKETLDGPRTVEKNGVYRVNWPGHKLNGRVLYVEDRKGCTYLPSQYIYAFENADSFPCEHGHFDCAHWNHGPCADEIAATIDLNAEKEDGQ